MTVEKLKKDVKLVRECIVHWDRVIQGVDRPNAQSCSLCQEYLLNAGMDSCKKCPIYEETGQTVCSGTPYPEAFSEYYNSSSVSERTRMRDFLWELEEKLQQKLHEARKHLFVEKPDTRIHKLDKDIKPSIDQKGEWEMTTEREEALELAQEAVSTIGAPTFHTLHTWHETFWIELVRLAKQRGADSAMNVLRDEAIISWALTAENEDDPRKLIHAIVDFAVQIALDPAVSKDACNLMKRGAEEQKRKDVEICRQWERQDVKADCCDAAQDECCMSLAALIEEQS